MLHFNFKTTKKLLFSDGPQVYLPRRAWNWLRIVCHIIFWGYNFSTSFFAFKKQLQPSPDEPASTNLFVFVAGVHMITTLLAFYIVGYRVVPSFMRSLLALRWKNEILLANVVYVAGCWFTMLCLFNVIDYWSFDYAFHHFTPPPPYVTRVWTFLEKTGPIGWLTEIVKGEFFIYTFVSGFNVSYVLLPLLLRIIRLSIAYGYDGISATEKNKMLIADQLQVLEVNQQLLEDQFKTLKEQINPHFLFNVFNNIYAQIHSTNKRAASLLGNLSKLMRYTLYETSDLFVPLSGELTFISNYIDIEKTRIFSPERIELTIEGNPSNYLVPPLLLITFIENAFKHGIDNSYSEGWVLIKISINENKNCLEAEVTNYVASDEPADGLPAVKQLPKVGGLGLKNARKRMDYLFKDKYTLLVSEPQNEYHLQLSIPLNRA
ncbi:sensor histidine kinase [Spirosoma luteum]|uniref:sensor histidine kinase n=1 Tax=Spirosoma luteum TaxID=431553 RepID=UPI0003764833|nr:histidine kinase [Spirosoma luteum]